MTKLAETIRILPGCVQKHPDADNLDVVDVYNNGIDFCLTKRGEFFPGDIAVFIPSFVDAMVPVSNPIFSFLSKDANSEGYCRVKNKKLRGIISRGLLLKAPEGVNEVDVDVSKHFHLKKWESKASADKPGYSLGKSFNSSGPDHVLPTMKYDIESLGKLHKVLRPGERVIMTEKIHGANCCFTLEGGELFVRSRSFWKKSASKIQKDLNLLETPDEDAWWSAINAGNIPSILNYPEPVIISTVQAGEEAVEVPCYASDFVFWGEIYGKVQYLTYGLNDKRFILFDIFNKNTKSWLSWDDLVKVSDTLSIPRVPVIYDGEWKVEDVNGSIRPTQEMFDFANGDSILAKLNGGSNIREGYVIRPGSDRIDPRTHGRIILKWVGNDYLGK